MNVELANQLRLSEGLLEGSFSFLCEVQFSFGFQVPIQCYCHFYFRMNSQGRPLPTFNRRAYCNPKESNADEYPYDERTPYFM